MMARRPDLALFLPRLERGGAERVILDLAAVLTSDGLDVDLVLASVGGALDRDLPNGVRRVDLRAQRTLAALLPLRGYLRRERPRALLATLEHANVVALLASRGLSGTRVCVREANTASHDLAHGGLRQRVLLPLMRGLYRRADAVIAASEGVANDLVEHLRVPHERLQVIANPVLTPRVWELASAPPPHPWFADDGPPTVLAVGRLTEQKRFDVLLRAFATASAQHPCRLVILGEGERRTDLEGIASKLGVADRVALPGFMENPFACMARCAVFVLSSAWEGLPNALIQAMALGAPVVATDCRSGPREVLDAGQHGALVPVDDVGAMSDAIVAALVNAVRFDAPRAWLERYDYRSVANHYARALGLA